MKSTCSGARLEINIEKDEKFDFQKLTRCKNIRSKSEALYFFQFKI